MGSLTKICREYSLMEAFTSVGLVQSATIQTLAPGVSAALLTTIAGLVWLWLTNLTLLMGVELDAALEFRKQLTSGDLAAP